MYVKYILYAGLGWAGLGYGGEMKYGKRSYSHRGSDLFFLIFYFLIKKRWGWEERDVEGRVKYLLLKKGVFCFWGWESLYLQDMSESVMSFG